MKLLWLLAGVVLGSPWGASGGWTWDESGARYGPPDRPHPLFGSVGLVPPTLWNHPGPEDSLLQYDGERGLLRLLLPRRKAVLEWPAPKGTPNAWTLAGGKVLTAEGRKVSVLFPPDEQGSPLADLPLPVTALASSPQGEPLARLLTGFWRRWDGNSWSPVPEPPGTETPNPDPQSSPEAEGSLEELGLWPEVRMLAARDLSLAAAEDVSPVLESLRRAESVLAGQGGLSVRSAGTLLEASFLPDALGKRTWEWTLRFHLVRGGVVAITETAGEELTSDLPGGLTWKEVLWVDLEVCPPEDREKKTFFRLISREGLPYWLKSG